MTSIGWWAVGPVGVAVEVAAQIGQLDQVRQPASQGGFDLAADPRAARGR
jgi:hypothetical protein